MGFWYELNSLVEDALFGVTGDGGIIGTATNKLIIEPCNAISDAIDKIDPDDSALANAAARVVDFVVDNPVKSALIVATTVAGGTLAYRYAPQIGALISKAGFGVKGGKLGGAAAQKAGQAWMGGGSLESGGGGIARGKKVISAIGTVAGLGTSAAAVGAVDDKHR